MDWLKLDSKFRLNLIIIMAKSKTPLKLTVGNIFDVSFDTMLRVSWREKQKDILRVIIVILTTPRIFLTFQICKMIYAGFNALRAV